jgi:hypothetical protein
MKHKHKGVGKCHGSHHGRQHGGGQERGGEHGNGGRGGRVKQNDPNQIEHRDEMVRKRDIDNASRVLIS